MAAVVSAPTGQQSLTAGGRVVVGIDDSPAGLAALRWAIAFARSRDARLVAVRAWAPGLPRHGGLRRHRSHTPVVIAFHATEPARAARSLTRRALRVAAPGALGDVDVTIKTPEGIPGPVLTQIASRDDDVLVVGTTPGPSLRRAVHGSVSAYCTTHSRCPVTVVTPPPGR